MINKKIKIQLLLNHVLQNFFKKSLFKSSSIKDLDESMNSKVIAGIGEYAFGFDENGFGYFFIFVDHNKEGFLWFRSSYKENGVYNSFERIIPTEYYKDKAIYLHDLTNLDDMRDLHLEKIRDLNNASTDISLKRIISEITFSRYSNRVNRLSKFKILGLIFISEMIHLKDNNFSRKKICSSYTEAYLDNIDNYCTKSFILGSFLIDNIDYIIKNRIPIKDAINLFKSIHFKNI